jgi:glycosyltransferase involved in cell wall biosynthesis
MFEAPLRICLLTYRGNPRSGGQGIYVRLLSRELAAMGHHVAVWRGQPYPELLPGTSLVKVPSLDLWNEQALLRIPRLTELRDPINLAEWGRTMLGEFPEPRTFSQRVVRGLDRMNGTATYDIVHDNQSLGPGLLRVQERFPVVATIHHPVTRDLRIALDAAPNIFRRYGLRRWYSFLTMQKHVARRLDRVLTVSEASARDLGHEFGIDPDRLSVVGNGINLDIFRPEPAVRRGTDRLITTLSADVPLKGFSFLLDALALLRRERPSVTLTVIGSPHGRSGTMQKIRRLGLDDAVHFTGRVPAEEIARRYAESTVAVVASLYEGFGFPAGEAMACEVPIVSTRAGALPEVVGEDGACGILVAPGSGEDLTRGIRTILDASEDARRRMGIAGRARVEQHFTWRRAAERTVDSYRHVIAERAAARETGCIVGSPALSVRTAISATNGHANGHPGREPGHSTPAALPETPAMARAHGQS